MKIRPSTTTSERQLCVALAATGRVASLDELANWRKDGLLPPLATSGLGAGRGRTYYWREDNILVQAEIVWDCMRRHGRRDQTLMTLFLSGLPVPLQRVRRLWLHRARLRKALSFQSFAPPSFPGLSNGAPGPGNFLKQALNCIGEAVDVDAQGQKVITALEHGLARSRHIRGSDATVSARQLWVIGSIVAPALEESNLVQECSDDEMREAQHYASMATDFLKRSNVPELHDDIIGGVGPLVFTCALALIRAGHRAMLDDAVEYIQSAQNEMRYRPGRSSAHAGIAP